MLPTKQASYFNKSRSLHNCQTLKKSKLGLSKKYSMRKAWNIEKIMLPKTLPFSKFFGQTFAINGPNTCQIPCPCVSERFRRRSFIWCQRRLAFRWCSFFEVICGMTVIYVEETIRCWPWQAEAWFAFSPTWLTFDWSCCARLPPVVRTAWHSNLNSKGMQFFVTLRSGWFYIWSISKSILGCCSIFGLRFSLVNVIFSCLEFFFVVIYQNYVQATLFVRFH